MPLTKFLFWNVGRRPLANLVADLAESHAIDVIILAECEVEAAVMLQTLNRNPSAGFHLPVGLSRQISIYTRFAREFLQPVFESERISIRRLILPARSPVLLVAVHLPSKLHHSEESQKFECVELIRNIELAENAAGHQRTILVGDFNMNPFEAGLVSAAGLNSVMSRNIASRGTRTVAGREYRFFYNPMWRHFGDAQDHTAGSYYYDASQHVNYYWNLFDQVLLRPDLAERFDASRLTILRSVGPVSLVRADGRPDPIAGSDHLPLVFAVEF